jgi:hypothetical protein
MQIHGCGIQSRSQMEPAYANETISISTSQNIALVADAQSAKNYCSLSIVFYPAGS